MEGLLVLLEILLVGAPIVGVIMTFGLKSRIFDLERSISDLKDKIMSLDRAIRQGGAETADSPLSFAHTEPPVPKTNRQGTMRPAVPKLNLLSPRYRDKARSRSKSL